MQILLAFFMPSKKKISAPQGIKLCEDMIVSGVARETILQLITKKYKISVGGIDKWIRQAKPAAEIRQKEAEELRVTQLQAAHLEALNKGLKSDLELEVFLCQIAMGDFEIEELIRGEAILRNASPAERIKAIEQLYKKRGSYAPTKIAATNKEGEDVAPAYNITLNLNS
jgi:hypothetical protein